MNICFCDTCDYPITPKFEGDKNICNCGRSTNRVTDKINVEKLKPCPFCGSKKDLQNGFIHPNYIISCYRCGVKMGHDRKDKVVGFWNNRYSDK